MKEDSTQVIQALTQQIEELIADVKGFQELTEDELNRQPGPDKWSVLECIAHINLYGLFYIDEIENKIIHAKHQSSPFFKPGLMGNYSANNMLPKGEVIPMKMKTFKHMNPSFSKVETIELEEFIQQQERFLTLLHKAKEVSLTKTKCKLTIPVLKFRLGDTLRFYTYHNIRHVLQAKNCLITLQAK